MISGASDTSVGKINTFTDIKCDVYILDISTDCDVQGRYFHIPTTKIRKLTTDLAANEISIVRYASWNLTLAVLDVPYSEFSYGIVDGNSTEVPKTLLTLQTNTEIDDIPHELKRRITTGMICI